MDHPVAQAHRRTWVVSSPVPRWSAWFHAAQAGRPGRPGRPRRSRAGRGLEVVQDLKKWDDEVTK